jgi:hypothetical protein
MTLSISTFTITLICHYAECRILFIIMLSIVMLNDIMQSVAFDLLLR